MGTAAVGPNYLSLKLKNREEVAERTIAFRFERLAGWTFKAGQSIDMTLVDPPESDSEGNTRAFSIASAPQEDTLMVATRMRDTAFKRTLRGLPLGSTVKIEGPSGNLTLQNNAAKTAVLLAGGVGITPFRSIVFRAAREKLPHRIFLFFSNRRPEDVAALVWGIGLSLGGTTGYAINPAGDFGPRVAHAILPIADKGNSDWGYGIVPILGPVIGGALAGALMRVVGF
jgi:NAD(P)H-flavin reductase